MQISCFSTEYYAFVLFGTLGVLAYPIGVPALKENSRKRKGTRVEEVEFHDNPLVSDEEDNESASPKNESVAQE